jgi:translation initiation factor 2B subunit (eIF-2B alpha/beta/delta family)
MEPQDNKQLAIRKAISAHEQAEAALMDLSKDAESASDSELIARIRANIETLKAQSQNTDPAQHT